MNLDEIPTPETDAAYKQWLFESDKSHKIRMGQTMESLERRLTIEKNRANEMGKLAHANACEAMEYRRLLTIARGTLIVIADESANLKHAERMADRALTQTAPKP